MKNTTLCYIENEKGEYLMLHRVKKQNDLNHDKWIGVGGKCEEGESVEYLQNTVENEGGLAFAAEVMRSYVARAVEMLSEYEPSEYRTALVNLCAYIAERDR